MTKKFIGWLLVFAFLIANLNCATVQSNPYPKSDIFISYSELPVPAKKSFEAVGTGWYWFGYTISEVDKNKLIEQELSKVQGAKGIKNFEVKVYQKSWYQYILLNPFTFITWPLIVLPLGILGITNRSFYIKGDIF